MQWIQLYELDDRLFASILEALGENFADYAVYETAHERRRDRGGVTVPPGSAGR